MEKKRLAPRLRRLSTTVALGAEVPVACGFLARLLGLAFLDPEEVGAGLLIPRCSSIHTFGMRFALDVYFLDERNLLVALHRAVQPRRLVSVRTATAVWERPAGRG